jgi:thiol-disulfide isomerase/thioredoxin
MEMKLRLFAAVLVLAGCSAIHQIHPSEPTDRGWVSRGLFLTPAYTPFATGLDTARVDSVLLPLVRASYRGERVIVIFGPWCGDSEREVPKFINLADAAGIPEDSVLFYSVDRTKKGDDGVPQSFHVEKVPTFIFELEGQEVGRIEESPRATMAADVLAILGAAMGR